MPPVEHSSPFESQKSQNGIKTCSVIKLRGTSFLCQRCMSKQNKTKLMSIKMCITEGVFGVSIIAGGGKRCNKHYQALSPDDRSPSLTIVLTWHRQPGTISENERGRYIEKAKDSYLNHQSRNVMWISPRCSGGTYNIPTPCQPISKKTLSETRERSRISNSISWSQYSSLEIN